MDSKVSSSVQTFATLTSEQLRQWQELADSLEANFSLSPGWIEITARSHDIIDDVEVLTATSGQELLAAMPVIFSKARSCGVPLKILELVGNYVSYHHSLVTRLEAHDALRLVLDFAKSRRADVVHFAGVEDDSGLVEALRLADVRGESTVHRLPGEASPYLRLNLGWDALVASQPKKFRYKLRKREEALSSSGRLSMRWYSAPHDSPDLLMAMQRIEGSSWKQNAGVAIFARPQETRYHELLIPFLAQQRALVANVLFSRDVPIAYNLCCLRNGWMGQLKTSFDASHAALSPGATVIDQVIRKAIELNAHEFDFLGDMDPHKLAWTKTIRTHSDYYLYSRSSLRGRLIGGAKRMRDIMRSVRERLSVQ